MTRRLTLYRREGCPLCDEIAPVAERFARDHGLVYEAADVDADGSLAATYGDDVPVVALDGRTVSRGALVPRALEQRLADALER